MSKLETTLRIKYSQQIEEYLKNNYSFEPLDKLHDIFLKPRNLSLKEFHPKKVALRFRTKIADKLSKLEFITINYDDSSYTHTNYLIKKGKQSEVKKLIMMMDIEKFLEVKTDSKIYKINDDLEIIQENLNRENLFFKFEASSEKAILAFLKNFPNEKKLRKNMIWLMAEKENLL